MKKKHQQDIESALNNALEPPKKRKPSPALNDILSQFAPPAPSENPTQLDSTHDNSTQLDSPPLASIAPTRDFNKRANSLERDALPAGLFPGTSKKLYDALYLRTRGAVIPVRSIQATRTELMRWAGIGGLNTFLSHMKHFTSVGLIVRQFEVGNKEGALYEVRLPEEINPTQLKSTQLRSTQRDSLSKRVHDSTQKVMRVESSNPIENTDTSSFLHTSFKTTDKSDDDALRVLQKTERELTGKNSSANDWLPLFELLSTELKIAAARTTISNVPAFLTEHLRRRLWKRDKAQITSESVEQGSDAAGTATARVNANQCGDCGGTGFYYPNGYDGGVAKCKHEKLKQ